MANFGADRVNMALLVLLYAMQGVPLGLTMGSIPFILKEKASYSEIGIFSLAGYPYAMKLLWSPLVDTFYHPMIGFRKSWILPIQLLTGVLMLFSGRQAQIWLDDGNVRCISTLFFVLVLLAATQDIAVDGWALTLLSRQNIGYASTCQTVGMNTGYFASFTIFLALNDPHFCNHYLRASPSTEGVVSLEGFFTFWGYVYITVTLLLLWKKEKAHLQPPLSPGPLAAKNSFELDDETPTLAPPPTLDPVPVARKESSLARRFRGPSDRTQPQLSGDPIQSVASDASDWVDGGRHGSEGAGSGSPFGIWLMYGRLWRVSMLKSIRKLSIVLLLCKLGTITSEAAAVFKLMEKGMTRETVSLIVLLEFPLELIFALFAGRWASRGHPFHPWMTGYHLRLVSAALTTLLVLLFPANATLASAPGSYLTLVLLGIVTSFASTLMFVSQGTFFARISDASMGGTYLTLVNTISNMGSAWPKAFVFLLMDWLTVQRCMENGSSAATLDLSCSTKHSYNSRTACADSGGVCLKVVDGFYLLSVVMIVIGFFIGRWFWRITRELESAKDDAWRA